MQPLQRWEQRAHRRQDRAERWAMAADPDLSRDLFVSATGVAVGSPSLSSA